MKKRNVRKLLYALLIILVVTIGVFFWANNELNKVNGKSTKVIDISSIIKPSNSSIYIKNTNVLSEDCSYFIENQDVVIENGKIISLSQNQTIDSTFIIINGTNKYLIPGLIDSHVHLKESKNDLYLYLANGITYVREMAGRPLNLEWRKSLQKNAIAPRMFITSPPVYSEKGLTGYYYAWTRQAINYSNKEDAEKAVKNIKEQGYDAIKMYGFVNPEMFKATVEIAKEYEIPVIGHIPQVNLETFYQSGQIEVAHIEELTKKNMDDFGKSIKNNPEEYLTFLKSNSDQIAKKLKKNNIYVTSTISLAESFPRQRFNLTSELNSVALRYANPKIIEGTDLHKLGWLPNENVYEYDGDDNAEARELSLTFWNTYVDAIHIMTKSLVDNKVPIMAGTDANVATVVPGFSLHNELESLSKSGMTNAQAIYSATVEPSNWMKSNTGKIKVGYHSDLILLTKNPLENIKNTKTIEYVFFDKYVINKTQIRKILKEIESANNENRNVEIEDYIN